MVVHYLSALCVQRRVLLWCFLGAEGAPDEMTDGGAQIELQKCNPPLRQGGP